MLPALPPESLSMPAAAAHCPAASPSRICISHRTGLPLPHPCRSPRGPLKVSPWLRALQWHPSTLGRNASSDGPTRPHSPWLLPTSADYPSLSVLTNGPDTLASVLFLNNKSTFCRRAFARATSSAQKACFPPDLHMALHFPPSSLRALVRCRLLSEILPPPSPPAVASSLFLFPLYDFWTTP